MLQGLKPSNKLHLIGPDELQNRLRDALVRGQLPDFALYLGDGGVSDWMALDESDDFNVASDLTSLLVVTLPDIATHLPRKINVVAIGPGDGIKERRVLQALGPRALSYWPTDVSSEMVDAALYSASDLPVQATGVVASLDDLPRMATLWPRPVLLCLLGNTFSNCDPNRLLAEVSQVLQPGDHFLFDANICPCGATDAWCERVEKAYQAPLNVRFNTQALTRLGVSDDALAFRLELIQEETAVGATWRTRKEMTVLSDALVQIGRGTVALAADTTLEMGFTYKHRAEQLQQLLKNHALDPVRNDLSDDGEGIVVLAAKRPAAA